MLQALGVSLLDELRSARVGAGPLPALAAAGYARDHAAFEALSDQRRLIADHLAGRLARRGTGPVAVLSAGCGDGSLDAPLAAALADVMPARSVRYVGIDPYAGSTAAFAAAMTDLDRTWITSEVLVSTFDDAAVTGLFDVVTFVHSMYYVPDVAATLRAAHDLLRPGGELLVLNAPRGVLNALVGVLAPPLEGHDQWFSDDVERGLAEAGLSVEESLTLEAWVDLDGASDAVLDFAVQARLTPELRPLVRAYLDAVSVRDPVGGDPLVPHPVDVYRVRRAPSYSSDAAPRLGHMADNESDETTPADDEVLDGTAEGNPIAGVEISDEDKAEAVTPDDNAREVDGPQVKHA